MESFCCLNDCYGFGHVQFRLESHKCTIDLVGEMIDDNGNDYPIIHAYISNRRFVRMYITTFQGYNISDYSQDELMSLVKPRIINRLNP